MEDGDAKVSAQDVVCFSGLRATSNEFMCKNKLFFCFVCFFCFGFLLSFNDNISVSGKVLHKEESALKTFDLNVTQSCAKNKLSEI